MYTYIVIKLAFVLTLGIASVTNAAELLGLQNPNIVVGSYLMSLKNTNYDIEPLNNTLRSHGIYLKQVIKSCHGDILEVESATVSNMRSMLSHSMVDSIEANSFVMLQGCETTQSTGIWGLNRINQREQLQISTSYEYKWSGTANGKGVDVYVVDSGIRVDHSQFENRASAGYVTQDLIEKEGGGDKNGHGTHVAGIIGSKTYGVAKESNLISVKVCDRNGSCQADDILEGLGYICLTEAVKRKQEKTQRKVVINMSIGGRSNYNEHEIEATIIKNLIKSNMTVVVAAGNSEEDACNFYPAQIPEAITVAATDIQDELSSFSNYGSCVDILAPGSKITSVGIQHRAAVAVKSGTSMAAPHVSGAAALYLSKTWADGRVPIPKQVQEYLLCQATEDKINLKGRGVVNKLLYVECDSKKCANEDTSGFLVPKAPNIYTVIVASVVVLALTQLQV